MRKAALCVAVLFLATIALPMAAEQGTQHKAKGTTHEMTGKIVSVDVAKKTVTFTTSEGKEQTAPVMKAAVEQLKKVKAGEEVVFTCLDNAKGEHTGITKIKPVMKAKS